MHDTTLTKKENGRSILLSPGNRCFIIIAMAALSARTLVELMPPALALPDQARMLRWTVLLGLLPLAWLGWRVAPLIGIGQPELAPHGKRLRLGLPALGGLGFAAVVVSADVLEIAPAITRNAHASFPAIVPLYLYLGLLITLLFRVVAATLLTFLVDRLLGRPGSRLLSRLFRLPRSPALPSAELVYWGVSLLLVLVLTAAQWVGFKEVAGEEALRSDGVVVVLALGGAFDLWLYGLYRHRGFSACLTAHLCYLAGWHMLWGGVIQQGL